MSERVRILQQVYVLMSQTMDCGCTLARAGVSTPSSPAAAAAATAAAEEEEEEQKKNNNKKNTKKI